MLYNAYCKGLHAHSIARGTHPKTRQKPTKTDKTKPACQAGVRGKVYQKVYISAVLKTFGGNPAIFSNYFLN